jgi:hypothetical protein
MTSVAATSGAGLAAPGSALASAVGGMQRAGAAIAADADAIATRGPDVETMVDLVVQPQVYAANAAVEGAVRDTTCSLLDVLA